MIEECHIRSEHYERDTTRRSLHYSRDSLQLLPIFVKSSVHKMKRINLVIRRPMDVSQHVRSREEYFGSGEVMSYGLMHPSIRETVQSEPNIDFAAFVGPEVLGKTDEDADASNLVDAAFIPLATRITIVPDKNDISNDDRWSTLVETFNLQAEQYYSN